MLRKKLKSHSQPNTPSTQSAEQVVPCQHCGIYIPRSIAIAHQQQLFCSQQHLDAHEVAEP